MEFSRFRWAVTGRIMGIVLSIFFLTYLFLQTSYIFLMFFMVFAILFQIYSLIHFVEKTNREVARFFRSIENDDFTQTFSLAKYGQSFRELSESFSSVTKRFLKLRSEKEENFQYLQTVVQHIRTGVIAFRDNGEVELVNNAAKKLLGIDQLRHLNSLDNNDSHLSKQLKSLKSGETSLLRYEKAGEWMHLAVNTTRFKIHNVAYTLLSLQDIKSELERERLAKELEIAQQIQNRLFPHENPKIPGFDVAGKCIPAREVGGDYYDFIPDKQGKWGIVIGDVSGKGLPASIYMTLTKGVFQSHANENIHPKDLLSRINRFMYESIERNVFITLYFAILDPTNHQFTLARAGHLPALHYQQQNAKLALIESKGIGVGLENGEIFDQTIDSVNITLSPGDWIIFYTDGFTEAMNSAKQQYGEERLFQIIKEHLDASSELMISNIIENIQQFTAGAEMHDDMTMIAIKVEKT
jgi:serine phosphatase RsbU (regulator of sigma subunit)